jgi:ABC-2 type transport system ATP-binding protein
LDYPPAVGRLLVVAAGALALALAWTGTAAAFTKQDEVVTMADGTPVATTLYLPDGAPPAAGWPAVMFLHGLGGTRGDLTPIVEPYAAAGYAVLTYDARGHGESGGTVGLDGPAEISDVRALFQRLAARPDVDDAHIGGWGVSYGGGAILRAAVEGLPFAALEPNITWSDLYGALLPQNLAKSGVVFAFVNEITRPSELIGQVKDDALQGRNLAALRDISAGRSSLAQLGQIRTPTFWFQGKRDFAFGMEQAIDAYARLAGPKRLYLGNLGHAPSTFASDDMPYFLKQGRLWFDRWLKGMPNGIDTGLKVEVAPTPFVATRVGRYAGLPPVATTSWPLAGRRTIGARGKVDLSTPRLAKTIETFGRASVQVRATPTGGWPRLVAVLSARTAAGAETIVADGGVPLAAGSRVVTIRLMSTSTPVPRGARLRLVLAADSTRQAAANLAYLPLGVPDGAKLTLANVKLTVPTLRTPVSR